MRWGEHLQDLDPKSTINSFSGAYWSVISDSTVISVVLFRYRATTTPVPCRHRCADRWTAWNSSRQLEHPKRHRQLQRRGWNSRKPTNRTFWWDVSGGCLRASRTIWFHSLLQVVLQVKPVYSPPQLLPIGKETITYIATDRSRNMKNCSFTVTVIGELVPLNSGSKQTTDNVCRLWFT